MSNYKSDNSLNGRERIALLHNNFDIVFKVAEENGVGHIVDAHGNEYMVMTNSTAKRFIADKLVSAK